MSNTNLELRVENVHGEAIPNLARFAQYIGIVSQINGSLIEQVTIDGRSAGPEFTSADGQHLMLGANHLPPMGAAKPSSVAAWCGVAVHGFAHSRYSPRTNEPLRHTLQTSRLHKTWNMVEDARIERLLLRDFPGWTPFLMGAVNYVLLRQGRKENQYDNGSTAQSLASVYPLLVGRTYLPVELRDEAFEAFADIHSDYIAGAVRDLIYRYMMLVDPGSADHDETIDIVRRLQSLLGDYGSDCGSTMVSESSAVEREWTDPGDPSDDDDDDDDGGDDGEGNYEVTDEDGDESEDGDDESDGDGESDDGESDGADGGGESDDGEPSDEGGDGVGDDDDPEGRDEGEGDDTDDEEYDGEGGSGSSGDGHSTNRLVDWSEAISSALEQDERLNDVAEAVTCGPMPTIRLKEETVIPTAVPTGVAMAEQEIARELRVLMDGARPGMRRRIDRGRFNVARVVRENGSTPAEEMFDRHDPGALRSTGCAVAMLADVSSSMGAPGLAGAMNSLWSVDRAVQSVRGKFKGWTFGTESKEMPSSVGSHVWTLPELDGSTNPYLGLTAAQAWLSQQREPNKLCIVATDGAWEAAKSCNEVLSSMLQAGVQVAVFGIDIDMAALSYRFSRLEGVVCRPIGSAADLGPAVGQMLVGRVRKAALRHR